jgi:hypothetical protein
MGVAGAPRQRIRQSTDHVRHGVRHQGRLAAAITLIAALAVLGLPTRARADCGGPEVALPSHQVRGVLPPLAIGDSTMLLALYELAAKGYDAEAQGCREFPAALALLRARKAQGTLPHMVVITLGANGSVTHADVGAALGLLCCTRLLVLVTPRELGGGSSSDAVVEREEAQRHPDRILLLDWVNDSRGHPEWFQPDGLHLTTSGALAFTRLLSRALPYAQPKPKRKPKRKPKPKKAKPGPHRDGARPASADAGAPPSLPGPEGPPPLSLRATAARVGYIAATISGPPGGRRGVSPVVSARRTATPRDSPCHTPPRGLGGQRRDCLSDRNARRGVDKPPGRPHPAAGGRRLRDATAR